MKKWSITAIVTLFAIADIGHDFATSNPILYFKEHPRSIILILVLAIVGGLIAFIMDRLRPQLKRVARLFTFGSTAVFLTVFTGYFLFEFICTPQIIRSNMGGYEIILAPLCMGVVSAWLWFEFYQIFRRRIP
jgi:fucose permease